MKLKLLSVAVFLGVQLYAQETVELSLSEALLKAQTDNVQLKKSDIDIQIAKQKVWETIATGLPQVNGHFDYNYYINQPVSMLPAQIMGGPSGSFVPVVFGTKQNATAGVTVNQLLFNGSYLVGLQSTRVYKKITELAKEKTSIAIKEAVILAYSSAVINQQNLTILENNLTIAEKNKNDVTAIYEAGLGELQTVEQVSYNYTSVKTAFNNVKRTHEAMLATLKYLLSIPQENNLVLSTGFDEIINENLMLISDRETEGFIKNHIDMRLMENEVKSQELLVKNEQAKRLPTLNAFFGTNYNAFSNEFDLHEKEWFNTTVVGVKLQVPIFSSFQAKSKVAQARFELDKKELEKRDLENNLKKEMHNKKIDYENALANFENTKELAKLSESIYNKEFVKFNEGIGNSNELSVAEKQKYDAQNQYVQAAFQLIQSKLAYDKAVGNL